jgi:hypothetical protein
MAQPAFDPDFGLRGTCTSDVSGFGGWPLAVFVGIDGRPTLVCQAKSQRKADRDDVSHANRFLRQQFSTIRVVSFPANGRPVPIGSEANRTSISDLDPTADTYAIRAIVSPDRVAVLGFIIRASREIPTLSIFSAGPIRNGVARWNLTGSVELAALSSINVRQYAIGWMGGDVVVAAPRAAAGGMEMLIYRHTDRRTVRMRVPRPPTLDLPANFDIRVRAGGMASESDRLYVGLTWEGIDPDVAGLRPSGVIDRGRASVIALRAARRAFAVDLDFGTDGTWIASSLDGEITTTDALVLDSASRPAIAGRAKRGATTSLFAASLDPISGDLFWSTYPAAGVLARPAGMTASAGGGFLLCGTTRDWDSNAPSDPGDAVVLRLASDGQPDAGFGTNGVVRFRLHGGTHPAACAETDAGEPLIASIVPWGWEAASAATQPCLTRLTPAGDPDWTFGTAGLCRHDGLGSVETIAIGPTGRVWSAGIAQQFLGTANSPQWRRVLTVSQLNVSGELESGFGGNGIATFPLPAWENLELLAVIPRASGGAVLNGTATLRGVTPATGGSWFLALQSNGQLDPTFGGRSRSGMRFYARRNILLVSELAGGSLQGFENGAVVRFTSGGAESGPAASVSASLIHQPSVLEPNGDFHSLVWGRLAGTFEVGLVRFRNGAIDATFGAAGAPSSSTPGNPDPRFVNLADLGVTLNAGQLEDRDRDQTIALADGTFLTLWTLPVDESVTVLGSTQNVTVTTKTLLLLAWASDGRPRTVPAWGGRAGKVISNRAGVPRNWIGWSYRCSVLQPDGSIVVGLAGDDTNGLPSFGMRPPAVISQIPYFCRLTPPDFHLDPIVGAGAGFLAERAPGCDFVVPKGTQTQAVDMAESQTPVAARLLPNGSVVAAMRCKHPYPNVGNVELQVPNLPLDGSIGMARLV